MRSHKFSAMDGLCFLISKLSLVFKACYSVSKKVDLDGSRDLISDLPEVLIGHILSFLPTKEAASTSVLAKKWRYLFALAYTIDLDDSVYVNPPEEETKVITVDGIMKMVTKNRNVSPVFMDFVDRVLTLQGNSPVHKFSLKLIDGDDPVDPIRIFGWIQNVLERGVLDLDLNVDLGKVCMLPSKILSNEKLVTVKVKFKLGLTFDIEDLYLPTVKTLYIDTIHIDNNGVGLSKLLSGCHMLENLVLVYKPWELWDFASVSVPTLKRLKFSWKRYQNPKSLSFDTPNLVYLDLTGTVAVKYPKVNFGSLAEAKIDLKMSVEQLELARLQVEEYNMVGNATDFVMGICSVKILYLSANTLEVLTLCCEAIPLFNNLTHLTIESKPKIGWQSLPGLLMNSPNLETLVLQGLAHKCGVVCVCQPYEVEEDEAEEFSTCLSSSPVKVLKIKKFGDDKLEKQIEQVEYFLKTMPNLEQLILYYDTSVVEDVTAVSSQLRTIDKVASYKCIVQLISEASTCVPYTVTITLP